MNTSTLPQQFSFEQILDVMNGWYERVSQVRWVPHGLCRYTESHRYKMIHERELRGPMGSEFRQL